MYVNKIELENFKSHVKTSIDFSQGLNLIIGLNGAGKSSVLQALGFAFVGLKEDGSYGDFITDFNGAGFANIRVDFVASDGLEYSVIRKIDPKKTSWEIISQTNVKRRGQKEVLPLLQNLLGIRGEVKKVYKRIITASQNDMTSVFLGTSAERKAFFNDLFNTKIYKEISSKEMKEYVESVTSKISEINGSLNILKKEIEELSTTSQELLKSKEELKKISKELREVENLEKERKRKLEMLRKKREEYLQLLEKKNSSLEKIQGLEKTMKENQKRLIDAQSAKKICEESKSQHERFEILERERKELEEQKVIAEDDVKKLGDLERELSDINNAIERAEAEITHEKGNVERHKEALHTLNDKINSKKKELKDLEDEKMKKVSEGNEILEELRSFQSLSTTVQKITDSLSRTDGMIETARNRIKNVDYPEEIENQTQKIEFFEKKAKELESVKEKKIELREKMSTLENSRSSLENGVCPILQEKCFNVEGKDVSEYFDEKIKNLKREFSSLEVVERKLQSEYEEMQSVKDKISQLKSEMAENENEKQKLQKLRDDKEKMIDDLRSSLEEVMSVTNLEPLAAREYVNSRLRELNGVHQKNLTEVSSIDAKMDDLKRDVRSLEEEKRAHSEETKKCEEKIEMYEHQKVSFNDKSEDLKSEISSLSRAREELEELKKRYLELSNTANQLKPFHEEYMKNINIAMGIDEISKRVENTVSELKIKKVEFENVSTRLEEVSNSYSDEEISSLEKEINTLDKKKDEFNSRFGSVRERIKSLELDLKKFKNAKEKSEKLKKDKEFLEKKKHLAEKIRKLLGVMGPEMASRYRKFIATRATEKYRALTQKVDIVKWSDDYDVHLISPIEGSSSDRRFSLLSGGEQMVVALAIRAALTETFSSTKFAIFDEPTVNLDEERRRSLSEYLPKLFENMEQILVVTHDETFREMAEKVINIKKENGMSVVKM